MMSVLFAALALLASSVVAYDPSRQDNLVLYYGQNSYGATHTDTAGWQKDLATYCADDVADVIPFAFVNVYFGTGNLPEINLANTCNAVDSGVFDGSNLANCQFLADDIAGCQAKGKLVTLSLGGATGAASFSSDAQGEEFAQTVWDLFFAGSSNTRPFGDAILDGIDLDIEGGGSTGYVAFVNKFRSLASGGSKPYYVTAAPQCPYPDAYMNPILDAVGVDAVYIQFYNNYCSVASGSINFGDWDNWAKTVSPNSDVKVFLGVPADTTAASSGYADAQSVINLAIAARDQYSSFGGVMIWDASQAYANGRFDATVKAAIQQDGTAPITTATTTAPASTTTTPTTTAPGTTTSAGTGGCAAAAAWSSTVAYTAGQQVTYNGHLYTANWWSYGSTFPLRAHRPNLLTAALAGTPGGEQQR
ncbi:glycoside hydrolase superfamily [Schizophyllum amplum]|uniref:chitinase n=1 Tax=Schizophyllum amplum TaxID=97359 RepID=A0A550CJP3_9AGAR|nr:glycoside hydrolase superfamily [Auriculariopsis ampla]